MPVYHAKISDSLFGYFSFFFVVSVERTRIYSMDIVRLEAAKYLLLTSLYTPRFKIDSTSKQREL